MNERMTGVDLAFQAWLLDGPERGPAEGLEVALVATRQVRQRPAWQVADWWRPTSWISSARTRRVAIAFVVAALVVLSLVAVAIVGSHRRLPPPFGPAANGRIVYDTGIGGEVYLANADGTHPDRLVAEGIERVPVFSPDGTKLAFYSRPVASRAGVNNSNNGLNVPFHLYVANADGSGIHVIAGGRTFHMCCLPPVAWSPDSRSIAFVALRMDEDDQLWVLPIEGPGPDHPLISDGASHSTPVWSPDGNWIAFVEESDGDQVIHRIVVTRPDGGDRRVLHEQRSAGDDEGGFGGSLRWSPDSTRLAYARGQNPDDPSDPPLHALLEVVGLDGVERRLLVEYSDWLNDLSWSPDGTSIAVMVGDPETSIHVVDVASGVSRPIARCSVHYDAPLRWSPDGRFLIDACPDGPGLFRADGSEYVSAPAIALPSEAAAIDIQRLAP
jgi:Tol biopolymer transport system component